MKFRKRPIVIDAVQFTPDMAMGWVPLPDGVVMMHRSHHPVNNVLYHHRHVIETLEGDMEVEIGDWVITGVKGEHYPCKPDIFEATYEPVAD